MEASPDASCCRPSKSHIHPTQGVVAISCERSSPVPEASLFPSLHKERNSIHGAGCEPGHGAISRMMATLPEFSIQELLRRNVKRFRGGLLFKAHKLLYLSTLGLIVKRREESKNLLPSLLKEKTSRSAECAPGHGVISRMMATLPEFSI